MDWSGHNCGPLKILFFPVPFLVYFTFFGSNYSVTEVRSGTVFMYLACTSVKKISDFAFMSNNMRYVNFL